MIRYRRRASICLSRIFNCWGFTSSYTETEALEKGEITPHWLDRLGARKGLPGGIEGESTIYYPDHLIRIDDPEVEPIFAGGEARLCPWKIADREPKLE